MASKVLSQIEIKKGEVWGSKRPLHSTMPTNPSIRKLLIYYPLSYAKKLVAHPVYRHIERIVTRLTLFRHFYKGFECQTREIASPNLVWKSTLPTGSAGSRIKTLGTFHL